MTLDKPFLKIAQKRYLVGCIHHHPKALLQTYLRDLLPTHTTWFLRIQVFHHHSIGNEFSKIDMSRCNFLKTNYSHGVFISRFTFECCLSVKWIFKNDDTIRGAWLLLFLPIRLDLKVEQIRGGKFDPVWKSTQTCHLMIRMPIDCSPRFFCSVSVGDIIRSRSCMFYCISWY